MGWLRQKILILVCVLSLYAHWKAPFQNFRNTRTVSYIRVWVQIHVQLEWYYRKMLISGLKNLHMLIHWDILIFDLKLW